MNFLCGFVPWREIVSYTFLIKLLIHSIRMTTLYPMMISDNVKSILNAIPHNVDLVAAAKTRSIDEIRQAIDAGIRIIGHNYVQEAEAMQNVINDDIEMHLIGHLQKNKANKAVPLFQMIQSVDSIELARKINNRCQLSKLTMPILIEVNSAREPQKAGLFPENVETVIQAMSDFQNLKIMGLMTMGPFVSNPEEIRPGFQETKKLFDHFKKIELDNVAMTKLSMGMSNSWEVAIEEGATMIRIGTGIFGKRY